MAKIIRRRKLRFRKSIFVLLAILIAGSFLIYYVPREKKKTQIKEMGYQDACVDILLEDEDLYSLIREKNYYSKLLEKKIIDGSLNMDYIDLYANIHNKEDISNLDLLLYCRLEDMGYDNLQLNDLFNRLYFHELTPLLTFDYQWDEQSYITDCLNNRDHNSEDAFSLDYDYKVLFRITEEIEQPEKINSLINKQYYLNQSYVPNDLENISLQYAVEGQRLRKEAAENFNALAEKAINAGHAFFLANSYWSYEDLDQLYKNQLSVYTPNQLDGMINRAGYNEYQSGLSMGIVFTNNQGDDLSKSESYQWLLNEIESYGFILRYPKDKEIITTIQAKPLQFRYLGSELAQKVNASKLTYDEYYCLYLKPWQDEQYKPKENILKEIEDYDV